MLERATRIACTIAATFFLGAAARADLTGKGEAGLVIATGNSETQSANAKLQLAQEIRDWKHSVGLSGVHASDAEATTARRWETFGQSDYGFSPKTFWFGAFRYERDEFSGFEYQATLSSGLGRKFIEADRTKFTGSAGFGYKRFDKRAAFDDAGVLIEPAATGEEVVFRGTLDYDHTFTPTSSVINKLIVEAAADNTYVQNDLTLQVRMTEVLALAAGYSVRHNTDPPAGFGKTDTLTTLNLVYEIK